jgi:hypothetical protein
MVEPVSTAGVALFGAGAWFASKLFGPSAEELGNQLKVFASARLTKILGRAEQVSSGKVSKALPPGFSYIFIQKASFSEDTEIITDMWAHLLVSASDGYSNRHLNFVDILSELGEREAVLLNEIAVPADGPWEATLTWTRRSHLRRKLAREFPAVCERGDPSEDELIAIARERMDRLFKANLMWSGRVTAVQYPYSDIDMKIVGNITTGLDVNSSYDILVRQRLLEPFSFDLSQSYSSPYIEGFFLTELGGEFVMACRGVDT